jgi:hypothetical protein
VALARLVTFVPLTLIKSADVNGEFNNILNNPIALISPSTGAINFNLQPHTNLLPSAITATSASQGQALIATSSGGAVFGSAVAGIGSQVKGLLGLLSSQVGTFSADQYVMQTTSLTQSWSVTATSSYSASVGTAGPAAGGRDQAAVFASTYVHWYAISTGPLSTAPAGLVSSNPPNIGPVALPTSYSGYTYLGGSIYSSASTTCPNPHRFRGAQAFHDAQVAVVTNGQSTVEAAISLAGTIPSNAGRVLLRAQYLTAHPEVQTVSFRYQTGQDYDVNVLTNSGIAGVVNREVLIPQVSQQFIYILSSQFVAAADALQVHVKGYSMPNGDG